MTQESFLVLQKENHALLRENNALHLEMIRCQEELEAKATAMATLEKEMEHKVKELQFLNAQKTQQLQKKDGELNKIYAQLQRLQEKPGTDESIELNKQLPDVERSFVPPRALPEVPNDDVWQRKMQALTLDNKALHDEVVQLQAHIASREAEIDRLGKLLKDGHQSKNYAEIKAMYDMEAYHLEQQLEHEQLLHQVDVLNDQVAKYERRLHDASDDIARAKHIAQQLPLLQDQNRRHLRDLEAATQALHALQADHAACATAHDDQVRALAALELAHANATDELAIQKALVHRLESTLAAATADNQAASHAADVAHADVSALAAEASALRPQLTALQAQLQSADATRADLQRQLDARDRELDVLRGRLGQRADDASRAVAASAEQAAAARALEEAVDDLKRQLRRREAALEAAERRAAELQNRVDALPPASPKTALVPQQTALDDMQTEIDNLQRDLDGMRRDKVQMAVANQREHDARAAAESATRAAEDQAAVAREQLTRAQAQVAELKGQLQQAKADAMAAQEAALALELEREAINRQLDGLKRAQQVLAKDEQDGAAWERQWQSAMQDKQQTEARLAGLTASHATVKKQLDKAAGELAASQEEQRGLARRVEELERAVATAVADGRAADEGKRYFKREFERATEELAACATRLQQEERAHEAAKAQLADRAREVQDLAMQLTRAKAQSTALDQQLEQARASRATLELQWTLAKEDGQTAGARCAALEAQVKRLTAETSQLQARA
ncbi:hypothetical protein ACHHYP_06660, partial [Achlya hypogyna]